MGSANLRLARGDSAGAIELCLEVIRQGLTESRLEQSCTLSLILSLSLSAPHSPEPYLTLATVYEETGDSQKLLQVCQKKICEKFFFYSRSSPCSDFGDLGSPAEE